MKNTLVFSNIVALSIVVACNVACSTQLNTPPAQHAVQVACYEDGKPIFPPIIAFSTDMGEHDLDAPFKVVFQNGKTMVVRSHGTCVSAELSTDEMAKLAASAAPPAPPAAPQSAPSSGTSSAPLSSPPQKK